MSVKGRIQRNFTQFGEQSVNRPKPPRLWSAKPKLTSGSGVMAVESLGMSRAARFASKQNFMDIKNPKTPKGGSKSKEGKQRTVKRGSLAANAQSSLTPNISKNISRKQISPAHDINYITEMQQRSAECLNRLIKEQQDTGIETIKPLYDNRLPSHGFEP